MDDIRRIRVLAAGGNAWHFVEFGVALGAGIAAGSVALVAFGGDSLIEAAAGFVILWRFASRSENAERRKQQLVAASYAVLVAYVGVEATRALVLAERPHANALAGWWWADPAAALAIGAVAAREAVESWRGEDGCC